MLPEGSLAQACVGVQYGANAAAASLKGNPRRVPVERWIIMEPLWLGIGGRSPASSAPHLLLSRLQDPAWVQISALPLRSLVP